MANWIHTFLSSAYKFFDRLKLKRRGTSLGENVIYNKLLEKLSRYDQVVEETLWNSSITQENYVENDYIKRVTNARDKLFDMALFMTERRWKITSSNTTLHTGIFSLFALAANFSHFITNTNIYLLVTLIFFCIVHCVGWHSKIVSTISDSRAIFSAIRECEKILPVRPFYSVIITSNISSNLIQRQFRFYEEYIPLLFLLIYLAFLITVYLQR